MSIALITGINGQDGSYLAELLLEKGYEVVGILKRNSICETQTTRIEHIRKDLELEYADMTDLASLVKVLKLHKPDEIYNLASQSHVRISFDQPLYTANATGLGVLNLLEAIRITDYNIKMYQASSSEMFGNNINEDGFQNEKTPMSPVSPYGCAKLFGHHMGKNYRHSYGMFVSNGILFNHESPRRGENFVTNKICREVVRIKKGLTEKLPLGNLDASRDWGHAKDYVQAMWLMLQENEPDDFVCATGLTHTVREFCDMAFKILDLDYRDYVTIEPRYLRPEELNILKGDSSKAYDKLGWKYIIKFEEIVEEMVEHWCNVL